MIQNLCNLVDENNMDTFYKIFIAEASQLPFFNELSDPNDVLTIINNLPETFQAMVIPFMPAKFSLSSGSQTSNGNVSWRHGISFPLVPQDAALQSLLKQYNNKEVVALMVRVSKSHLFGTQAQPLLFSYSDLNDSTKPGLKGYTISLQGETYGEAIYFEGKEAEFPVINRGLAFQLAGSL